MDGKGNTNMSNKSVNSGEEADVRKGPWTMEEDLILVNYIGNHGEGVWNSLARSAGTSCVYGRRSSIPLPLTASWCSLRRTEAHGEELPASLAQLPAAGLAAR